MSADFFCSPFSRISLKCESKMLGPKNKRKIQSSQMEPLFFLIRNVKLLILHVCPEALSRAPTRILRKYWRIFRFWCHSFETFIEVIGRTCLNKAIKINRLIFIRKKMIDVRIIEALRHFFTTMSEFWNLSLYFNHSLFIKYRIQLSCTSYYYVSHESWIQVKTML